MSVTVKCDDLRYFLRTNYSSTLQKVYTHGHTDVWHYFVWSVTSCRRRRYSRIYYTYSLLYNTTCKYFFILYIIIYTYIQSYADNLFRTGILVDVTRVDDTFRVTVLRYIYVLKVQQLLYKGAAYAIVSWSFTAKKHVQYSVNGCFHPKNLTRLDYVVKNVLLSWTLQLSNAHYVLYTFSLHSKFGFSQIRPMVWAVRW